SRIFLLSPAFCGGQRARLLARPAASFDLAVRLRTPPGAPLGQVFAFLSGLYFRGKLAYAAAFARPPAGTAGALVITPCEGLRSPEEPIDLPRLRGFAKVSVAATERRYREPLLRDALALAARLDPEAEVVLLGSVASDKYVEVLGTALGGRLRFPAEFVGRGDMSRGGLMLRCAEEGRELGYLPVGGAARRGPRPPKLPPHPR